MKELYELKEKLMDALEEYGKKEMTASNLDAVDKLAHATKNLCKVIEEAEGYSETSYGSYANGSGRGYSNMDMSYARGRSGNVRRDAMGRYSSHGDMVGELRSLMEDAPDEKTRMEFDRFIRKIEGMA